MTKARPLALIAVVAALVAAPAAAEAKIVVHGTFKSMKWPTITYTSSHGTYTATWIGMRHYRLAGTIDGKRLKGSFRTKQSATKTRYTARGTGRLGGRKVRITGGGANSLQTSTLILR